MIKGRNVRAMLKEAGSFARFKNRLSHLLGVRHDPVTERSYIDQGARQIHPNEFSVRELTEHFLGHEFVSELATGGMGSARAGILAQALDGRTQERMLAEDVAPVGPTVFQDISAWNATISGLVEVRILEAYRSPDFIGDEFVEVQPTRVNGGKITGVPYPAPRGEVTQPGVEFANVGMNELWVFARPNMKVGLKLSLTREAVVYDLTGELMSRAESLGLGLGMEREVLIAGGVLGLNYVAASAMATQSVLAQIQDSFRMNAQLSDAANPTYQTAGVTTNPNLPNAYNYVNKVTGSSGFTDWTSLQTPRQTLNLMRDPVNKLPMKAAIKKLYVDPYVWDLVKRVQHAAQVFNVTGTPATSYNSVNQGAGSTFPPVGTQGAGFPPDSQLADWTPYTSNIWHQLLLDAGVSEANARIRFLAGDPQKAFCWRSAWDTRVDQANPTSSELLGRDIINEWVGQFSGQFAVREPRYVVLTTE